MHRAGRLHRGRRGGTARRDHWRHRGGAADSVARTGGGSAAALRGKTLVGAAASVAELGDITACQSTPAHGARANPVPSAVARVATVITVTSLGTMRADVDRAPGASVPGSDQPRAVAEAGRTWPGRSATPRGRRRNGYVGVTASSPARESRRPQSPPLPRANWRASSGRPPDRRNLPALDTQIGVAHQAEAESPTRLLIHAFTASFYRWESTIAG